VDYVEPKTEAKEPEKAEKKNDSGYADKFLAAVKEQVVNEFKVGEDHIRPWRDTKRGYLKLYINQRKNPKKVGDTLMFSSHQTILAALYKDRQSAEWMGREEEDIDRAEELNALFEFDYDQMGKAEHDYGKIFDTSGIGIGIEDWSHFDRDSLTPIPDLWDPLNFVYDPKATSINGNKLGRGACRFIYRTVGKTMKEMEDHGGYFCLDELKPAAEEVSDEAEKNQQERNAARGTSEGFDELKENAYFELIQGYTWIDGKRYLVEAGKEGGHVVRLSKCKTDYWPLQDYRIYPDPHVFLTPGVWDFTEDKQRARAILQNYTLDAAKYDVLPEWLFDKNKIKNKQQLREHKAGKYIEGENIDGNSIIPLQKPTIHQFSQGIMQELETNAQKALATPEIQQGILFQQKRTATEIAEASANVDTRYSLTASIIGMAEAAAAMMWLDSNKRNFKKGVDKKMIRVIGAFGPTPTPITYDTFDFKADPDVKIESRFISQARKREERNNMTVFAQLLLQTPGSNMRSFIKDFGRLSFRKAVVDKYLPPTIDEMRAEQENEALNEDTLQGVVIEPTDDHKTHLEIHGKAADTKAKMAHIEAHKKAMMIQRNQPELFAGLAPEAGGPAQPANGQGPGQQAGPATPQAKIQELIQQ
jgi:hypothetical protein